MIGRFCADGTILLANKACARAWGFTGRDMRGANLYDHVSAARAERNKKHLALLSATKREVSFEECEDLPKSQRWTLWKYIALDFDEQKQWSEIEVVGIDITKSKQDEQELHAVNARLRQAESDLHRAQAIGQIGSWHYNSATGPYGWSPETYRIFGIPESTPAELALFLNAAHPLDRDSVEAAWLEALRDKSDHDIEHRIVANGEVKWVHERAVLERDESGELLGVYGTCQDITKSKRAEEELMATNARLRAAERDLNRAQAAAQIGSFWIDLVSRRPVWSEETHRIFGIPKSTRVTHDVLIATVHSDDRVRVTEAWRSGAQNRGGADELEIQYRVIVDGAVRGVHERSARVWDDESNLVEVYGTCQDITETKRAEHGLLAVNAQLHEATSDLNRAQEIAQMGSWWRNGPTGELHWSEETYRIYGAPPATRATYEAFIALVHPEDRLHVESNWRSAINDRDCTDFETRHRIIADGAVKWVHQRAVFTRDKDGNLIETRGTCQDITATKTAEEELRRSETRFRALVTVSSELVVRCDEFGRMIGAPQAWESYSGQTPKQFANGGWARVVHQDHRPTALAAWRKALLTNKAFDVECRIRRHDGAWRWMRWTGVPVRDDSQVIVELVSMFSDITQRKDAELALEARVKERTAAETAAKDEAMRANAQKSRFLSAVGHDLRQPLHAAMLYMSVLERRLATADQIELHEKIGRALESTSEMLTTLLDVSRLESGSVARDPRDFSLQNSIDRVIANSRALAEEKGLRIVNASSTLSAHTDQGLFERIIDNFVTNAVRYTEKGGTITVSCSRTETGVRVTVQDTGVGIPEESLEKIFDEYVQIDNKARTRSNGLGLGLAIAKHIANLLGCRLNVASRVGEGSTFSVEAPAAVGATLPRQSPSSAEAPLPHDGPLLLIEDDPTIADAVIMELRESGVAVTHAANGNEAFALLQSGLRPALIVSDYWLPHENGVDLIARLRAALGETVPALLVTGDTALQASAIDLMQCRVVHKPLEAHALMATLRQMAA